MKKLTPVHIEALEAELQRNGYVKGRKAGQGLTARTVLHVHRTLSQALAHAVQTGVLFKNPAEQVKPPRPPRREIAILSKAEVATLLREAGPLYLPVTTGMRRGEILGLRWSDIDLKAARLTVNQSLERLGGKTTFKPPKTAGSRRTITLPALTVEALSAHRAEQARISAGELVFSHGGDTVGPGQPHQGLRQIDPGHGGKAHHLSRSASYPYLPPADGWGACEGGE